MKITKQQLKKMIREQIEGYDPHKFVEEINNLHAQFVRLKQVSPFRSGDVVATMGDVEKAFWGLQEDMQLELETRKK